MKIVEVLRRKIESLEDSYELIGTELKLRRIKLSKTQEYICRNTCSISYLSKIENAEIKPNPKMLEEICKRLKITKESLETINNSKKIYEDIFKGIFNNDIKPLADAYEKVKGLNNYRAKLIMFLYYIYFEDVKNAEKQYKELDKLVSCMMLNDLVVLSFAEILYFFKLNYLADAYEIINELDSIALPFAYLRPLIISVKLDIFLLINSNLFLAQASELKECYIKKCSYKNIELLDQKIRRYYIRNKYFAMIELDEENLGDHDALLYSELSSQSVVHYRDGYSNFAKLLYYSYENVEKFKALYDKLSINLDYSQRLLIDSIYSLYFDEDYYNKIVEIYYPAALALNDEIVISIMEKFVIEAFTKKQRYKRIIDIVRNQEKRRKDWV